MEVFSHDQGWSRGSRISVSSVTSRRKRDGHVRLDQETGFRIPPVSASSGGRENPAYRGTLLIRNCLSLGPYSRPVPRALRWSLGGGHFFMREVPL